MVLWFCDVIYFPSSSSSRGRDDDEVICKYRNLVFPFDASTEVLFPSSSFVHPLNPNKKQLSSLIEVRPHMTTSRISCFMMMKFMVHDSLRPNESPGQTER